MRTRELLHKRSQIVAIPFIDSEHFEEAYAPAGTVLFQEVGQPSSDRISFRAIVLSK